jgi:hypothetical protein
MTAYRAGGEAPCYKCDRATSDVCATCGQPTCERHLDGRAQCGKCDEALYRYMRAEDSFIVGGSLPILLIGGVLLGLLVPTLVPLAIAMPFIGFPAVLFLRKKQRRAKFFRMMRERGALPEPKVLDPDHAEAARMVARMEKDLRKRK